MKSSTMNRLGLFTNHGLYTKPLVMNSVKVLSTTQSNPLSDHNNKSNFRRESLTCDKNNIANQETKRRRISSVLSPSTPSPFTTRLLPQSVRDFIEDKANLVNCSNIHICDGSEAESDAIIQLMRRQGMIEPLEKHDNCWLARTDPRDVARVESKTVIGTRNKHDTVPRAMVGAKAGRLGNWMHVDHLDQELGSRFANCMTGRTMYVIPFSMGPIGSNLSKVGIELTDSPYVVASMRIMTRVSRQIFDLIREGDDFVRCIHSVGCPLKQSNNNVSDNPNNNENQQQQQQKENSKDAVQKPVTNDNWPCNPERTLIAHIPERREIASFGSGYGGNSLLGKKCFALRMAGILGHKEGWLAEHMLILGITNPQGVKRYVAAAFPSACGKTNLAMMTPTLPGYRIECVGDDIAWMRFDENGTLRAINPEAGFFGVAPGTNERTNPIAMKTIERNTIFTNVARTDDGDYYWQGLEHRLTPGTRIKSWLGQPWTPDSDKPAAHPNSRFCVPAAQCPIIDSNWESSEGVPISAIIFGGRRPHGVPLVYESLSWQHGVFVGASMRSEATAAAEHAAGKQIMHDPFAMRPFFGYNFGHYLTHWLTLGQRQAQQKPQMTLPKIFHVNWFRKHPKTGKFLWPGFGDNARVLDWICRRCSDDPSATAKLTPIGLVPQPEAINLNGLEDKDIDLDTLLSVPRDFWLTEQAQIDEYLKTNVGQDLPEQIEAESRELKQRLVQYEPPN